MEREVFYALVNSLSEFSDRTKKAESFSEEYFVSTFNQINQFIHAFPIRYDRLDLFRSRRIAYATDLENVKQMGPPPAHRVKRLGRCNHVGQPVLYAAHDVPTSFLEVGFDEAKSCAVTIRLRLREGQALVLWPIGELDHYRRHRRTRLDVPGIGAKIEALIKPLEHYEYNALHYIDAYLADYFSRAQGSEPHLFEICARIANAFMNVDGIDGIVYPSVKHQGGVNCAIKADLFATKFEVERFFLTTRVHDLGYGLFEFFEHAHGTRLNDRGDFIWQGNPHFNARATIPLSAES